MAGIAPQGVQPFQHARTAAVQSRRGGKLRRRHGGRGQGSGGALDEPSPGGAGQDASCAIQRAATEV
jgi:hypothetical protein